MRLIDADELKENMMIAFDCENATKYGNKDAEQQAHSYSTLMLYEISNIVEDCIDNAPTVTVEPETKVVANVTFNKEQVEELVEKAKADVLAQIERPQDECRTCIHRDPEDKRCDCGGLERQGCLFPVSDDYFCKFYEKGGAE